jgi:hypothetical protein
VSIEEGVILAPSSHRGMKGWRPAVVAGAMAWLTVCAFPAVASAQADYTGPAVVPPADAYVGSLENEPEAALLRWRIGTEVQRTLWVHFMSPPPERSDFWDETVRAMQAWNAIGGVPVAFQPTLHAQSADVEFRWIRRFDTHQAGTTDWETDGEGWLSSAVVTLATQHEGGTPMSDEFLLLVALHELGHVIGLPHSDDPSDVMHPGNRNMALSDRDIRSARQMYERLHSEKVSGP